MPPESAEPEVVPHKTSTRLTRVLWVCIALTVIIGAALAVVRPTLFSSLWQSQQKLPGTLIMQVPGEWAVSADTTVHGLVSYIPVSGHAEMLAAASGTEVSLLPDTVSPDGKNMLGVQTIASSTALVLLTRDGQIKRQLVQSPSGTSFVNLVWSHDGSRISYLEVHDPNSLPSAPDGKPYFTVKGTTTTLRAGLTLPKEYQSVVRVISTDGSSGPVTLGPGIPVTFSPDASKLMMQTKDGLAEVTTKDGVSSPVRGLESEQNIVDGRTDTSGTYLVLTHTTGPANVYVMNWGTATLQFVGVLPASDIHLVTMSGDKILVVDAGTATTYVVVGNAVVKRTLYQLALPANVQLISWIP